MKVEFGCGNKPSKKNYKTCDIRNLPGIDFVCPAWEIDKYVPTNSVDEIYSRHFFEHLTFAQGERLVKIWFKILKPSGICKIIVPNLEFHLQQFLTKTNLDHARAGLWGWQRESDNSNWDLHKSGYDEESLMILFLKNGFINPQRRKKHSMHLYMFFTKPI